MLLYVALAHYIIEPIYGNSIPNFWPRIELVHWMEEYDFRG